MRAITTVALTVAVLLGCTSTARANGPISALQCATINPNPIVTSCTYYLPPILDLYGRLPYDTVSVYSDCVKERCVCTGAAVNTDITTDGLYCNESGWMESGYTTCNRFNYCFTNFWKCINTAAMTRYNENFQELTDGEIDLTTDITVHGRTPGEQFKVTDTYRSCRLKMCAAADSRENCGLVTCLPNYTQCNEYILPPPLPNTHQLCTQGCRAVLVMMAMTIAVVTFAFLCACCCPAQVIVSEPVIKEEGDSAKEKKSDDDDVTSEVTTSQQGKSNEGTQPKAVRSHSDNNSATHTNHNSHMSDTKKEKKSAGGNTPKSHEEMPTTEIQQRGNNNSNSNDPF